MKLKRFLAGPDRTAGKREHGDGKALPTGFHKEETVKQFAMAMATVMLAAGLVAVGADDSVAEGKACVRTKFDTKLTEDACKKGGQDEAKKAWKAWTAEAKKTEPKMACKTCHDKQAPNYEVNATGLETYRKLGGK